MKRPKLYYVWRFLQYFCWEFSKIFESCAERGFLATLKAEYMQDAQSAAAQIDGSVQVRALMRVDEPLRCSWDLCNMSKRPPVMHPGAFFNSEAVSAW